MGECFIFFPSIHMRTEAVDGIARRVAFSIFLEKASGGRSLLESRPAYRDFDSQNNS